MEPAEASGPTPRALLQLGGVNVARQQLGIVLALDCERIICLARDVSPALIALQKVAEDAGARFHVVSRLRGLFGLISAADEVIVLADGLLAPPGELVRMLTGRLQVLAQPVERGLSRGFERIDATHASAGAMRIPGSLVERLSDLPPDCDVASSLTRIALQSGVPLHELGADQGHAWRLIRSEAEAQAVEQEWVSAATRLDPVFTPGRAIAAVGVRALGPGLLHGGTRATTVVAAAALIALLGLGAAWLGYAAVGLALVGIAWTIGLAARLLVGIERSAMSLPFDNATRHWLWSMALDAILVAILVVGLVRDRASLLQVLFAPFVLVGLARFVPQALPHRIGRWVSDRALLAWLLAVTAVAGMLGSAVQVLALGLLGLGIVLTDRKARLT